MPSALSVFPNRACASAIAATYSELLPERCCANFKFCDRVAALKRRHDPTNFFRMNRNIEPAARPAVAVTEQARLRCFVWFASTGSTRSRKWLQDQFLAQRTGAIV